MLDPPAHSMRVETSATQVPPFALFESFTFQSFSASRANNAKSGTSRSGNGGAVLAH